MVVGFLGDLWRSIFEPGSSPAVVKAIHGSFVLLVSTLLLMLFLTHSIHFAFLLLISIALWISTAWFITEYNKFLLDQKNNEKHEEPEKKDSVAASSLASIEPDVKSRQL